MMGLITVMAKVVLMSEEDMENAEYNAELNLKAKSSKWRWREVAIHTDDIRRIVQYNSTKCIIDGYDGIQTLVNEPFKDVYEKWNSNITLDNSIEFIPDEDILEEEEE